MKLRNGVRTARRAPVAASRTRTMATPLRRNGTAPICGGGDAKSAAKIKAVPCWCFHGDADNVVVPKRSQDMIEALKAAGGKPKYTEYPGVGHNSWDKAYGTKELYDWLLEHKLK